MMPEAVPDLEGPAEQQQRLRPPGQGPRCRGAGRRGTGAGAETTQGAQRERNAERINGGRLEVNSG